MKSRVTPLAASTTRKGPNGVGLGRPRISERNVADTCLSWAPTIVWLRRTGMDASLPGPRGDADFDGDADADADETLQRPRRRSSLPRPHSRRQAREETS